jgi:N-acetylglucosaminyldiphosphoundecaprenol N-acetyl-beta-D-mannosaminyltransferase
MNYLASWPLIVQICSFFTKLIDYQLITNKKVQYYCKKGYFYNMHPKVNILGVQVSSFSNKEMLDIFTHCIESNQKTQVAITPVNSVLAALKNQEVMQVYNNAEIVLCDSVPMQWSSRFLGTPIKERITGLDVLPDLVHLCAKKNFSIFLLGASPGVGAQLQKVILDKYPNCRVLGVYVPPFMQVFSPEENSKMLEAVNAAAPDVLLVSLTAPKQDIWIAQNKAQLNASLLVGIGGAFEVMAGLVKRSPKWVQVAGLEWFYRFLQEPKRLFRRYFIEAPQFIPLIIKQKWKGDR